LAGLACLPGHAQAPGQFLCSARVAAIGEGLELDQGQIGVVQGAFFGAVHVGARDRF
jgi:hypothetical protein